MSGAVTNVTDFNLRDAVAASQTTAASQMLTLDCDSTAYWTCGQTSYMFFETVG